VPSDPFFIERIALMATFPASHHSPFHNPVHFGHSSGRAKKLSDYSPDYCPICVGLRMISKAGIELENLGRF
jgi:hypothetical protein